MDRRAAYVDELVSTLRTALEGAEIVQKYPANRVALRTVERHLKVARAILRDVKPIDPELALKRPAD